MVTAKINEKENNKKVAKIIWEKDELIRNLTYQTQELEESLGRLQKENAGLRILFEEGRSLLSRVFDDGEKFSYLGAIKALVKRIEKLQEFIKQNELEVPKM